MPELETRRLGRTELTPKAIGLGCAFLGSPQRVSDDEGIATVREAIDRGINFIDTSAAYGGGESERRVGLALQEDTGRRFICRRKRVPIGIGGTIIRPSRSGGRLRIV